MPEVAYFTESKLAASEEVSMYSLITGSFKSEENALSQVNILKERGFSPEIVVAPNGFFRVCAMACSDMNTAITKKDSITAKFPGAWISRKYNMTDSVLAMQLVHPIYFIILPLLTFSAGETITSFPSLSSAIRIIPLTQYLLSFGFKICNN